MNLENRVETLEHELKILKNEIEGTLLEIQNQVLIHYYPALRAEDSTPPQEIPPLPPSRTKAKKEVPAEGTPALEGTAPILGVAALQMKEVSLSDFTHAQQEEAPPLLDDEQFPTDNTLGQTALSYLAKWVNYAVAQIGKAQAADVLESCADAADCTAAVKATLRQFITLSTEDAPPSHVDTTTLMDVLLKLNKVFDQVAALDTQTADHPVAH